MSLPVSFSAHQWPTTIKGRLLLNVRKDNRWAVFVVHKSLANCLLRPGVLDYAGSAASWLDAVSKLAKEQHGDKQGYRLTTRGRPVRAPVDCGLIVLDYDAKTYLSCQDYSSSLKVDLQLWGLTTRNAAHPQRQWLQALAQTGHLKTAVWEDGSADALPKPPTDVLDTATWWERTLFEARGLPPPESYPDAFSVPVTFPLQPAGWSTLLEVEPEQAATLLEILMPSLRADEIQQWSQWAQAHECEGVLSLLRRMQAAESLESSLPCSPVSRPVKPRM